MATRSATIQQGALVDISTALGLETGRGYLLELGPGAQGMDSVWIANGGDPNDATVGGHLLTSGVDRGRFIRQGPQTWFARFYGDPKFPRSTQLTATEADDCS